MKSLARGNMLFKIRDVVNKSHVGLQAQVIKGVDVELCLLPSVLYLGELHIEHADLRKNSAKNT
jgi:hypothetical protein